MGKTRTKRIQQVECIIFNWDTGKYLKIRSGVDSIPYRFRCTWCFFGSTERDFDLGLFEWVDNKEMATEIPVSQIDDFVCWMHRYTDFVVARSTRTVFV